MRTPRTILAAALGAPFALALAPAAARAEFLYTNTFEDPAGTTYAEWTSTAGAAAAARTPSGRGFLGEFGSGTVSLTLTDLPANSLLTLSFDLFVIRSWDGNGPAFGPDVWSLGVAGGPTLLVTTFSNADFPIGGPPPQPVPQAYPGPFPGGDNPARTGAAENNTLGYTFFYGSIGEVRPVDSVYRLPFTFGHTDSSVVFNFTGFPLESLADESWGLDNVQVQAVPVPAPGGLALLSLGTLGLAGYARRKRPRGVTPGGPAPG